MTAAESRPPAGGDSPLVQPEGVDAGSAAQSEARDHGGKGSVLGGGDASGAPGTAMNLDQDPSDEEGDEMAGTTEVSGSGQDDGSIS